MAIILVVDESWLIRRVVKRVLKKAGHQVVTGKDSRQCLEKVEKHDPDLVVLDPLGSKSQDLELLKALRRQFPWIPLVILTADIQAESHRQIRDLGAGRILHKPPRGNELVDAAAQALGQMT